MDKLAEVISRRYRMNADKSLRDAYDQDPDFLDTGSDAEFATLNREKILEVLADKSKFKQLVELFVKRSIEFTYASNQFMQIDRREEAGLRRIYTKYLLEIEQVLVENNTDEGLADGMSRLVAGHFRDLRANITRFFDPETGGDAHQNVILQKVVNAEYTPEMQLELLGIRPETLAEPVLDLGCGKSGSLVAYLNRNGLRAVGVDRVVEDSPALIQGDWLDYPLEPEQWGTIISHMAFSNHFLFHHLYRHGSIVPYARRYMDILGSLKPNGSFYYTPGLSFLEGYLAQEKYAVSRKWVIEQKGLYACRVTVRVSTARSAY